MEPECFLCGDQGKTDIMIVKDIQLDLSYVQFQKILLDVQPLFNQNKTNSAMNSTT